VKIYLKLLGLSITTILACADVKAEDLNFGKATPSAEQIIEHLKGASPAVADSPVNADTPVAAEDDGYQDVDKGQSRNLVFMNSAGKKTANQRAKLKTDAPRENISAAVNEAAVSLVVLFDYNSFTLSDEAKQKLAPLAQALKSPEMQGLRFKIEGHTDAVGGDAFNQDLSLRRAEAIKNYLTSQFDVDSASIEVDGKGKQGLADPKHPDSELNRRVRVVRLGG
jgi:outer membrane protein OmpA-like peptidoglycan-associated protein